MFVLDTSSLLLLSRSKSFFPYSYALTRGVIRELEKKNVKLTVNKHYLLLCPKGSFKTADQELIFLVRRLPFLSVVTEDYFLRKKISGVSVRKFLINR